MTLTFIDAGVLIAASRGGAELAVREALRALLGRLTATMQRGTAEQFAAVASFPRRSP